MQITDTQHTTTLAALIAAVEVKQAAGPDAAGVQISALTGDSRAVTPGALFVAVRGVNVDAHKFIPQAVAAGAAAIVCEELPAVADAAVAYIVVPDSAIALGQLASQWYGNPSQKLTLVGVTGTNGKTTIATLLYDMARLAGHKAGLLSTVANKIDGTIYPADHTTPDPLQLNRLLAEMVSHGCSFAAMEVSSHAAAQHRIAGLTFAGGIFTNITRDHLDYHKTFKNYLDAKKSFFDGLPASAFAITNIDDRNGDIMIQGTAARRYTYSLQMPADFTAQVIEDRIEGMVMHFSDTVAAGADPHASTTDVTTNFVGRFNASNLLAVYGAARLLGFDAVDALRGISMLHPVAGRFQTFTGEGGITAIVDYAHTPDALANVLDTINQVVGKCHAVITVCGCGGNRDRGKRPIMAAEAARRSDRVILTADNPRDEDPSAIIDEMLAGLDEEARERTLTIVDRRQAIRTAVALATAGDVVLVAGKGHEDYQETANHHREHFDDREEVSKALHIIS